MLRPLRVAVLCSRRCPGARDLISLGTRGERWELVGALSTEEEMTDRHLFNRANVPVLSHPIRAFYRRRGRPLADFTVRAEYDEEVAHLLDPFRPDLLLFSSYLYVATPALLDRYGGRVINIHGSDLYRHDPGGRPKYLGLRAVRDAILAGERETRATAHWVTEDVDLGPPILRSAAFPVSSLVPAALARQDLASVRAYAFAHQEWMLSQAWGPMWRDVLGLVTSGRAVPGESEPPVWKRDDWSRLPTEAAVAGMRR
jgi:folate-dependent phosphoribosylglycinamide formyltransferase PurN